MQKLNEWLAQEVPLIDSGLFMLAGVAVGLWLGSLASWLILGV
jgi:hypothetical protein